MEFGFLGHGSSSKVQWTIVADCCSASVFGISCRGGASFEKGRRNCKALHWERQYTEFNQNLLILLGCDANGFKRLGPIAKWPPPVGWKTSELESNVWKVMWKESPIRRRQHTPECHASLWQKTGGWFGGDTPMLDLWLTCRHFSAKGDFHWIWSNLNDPEWP